MLINDDCLRYQYKCQIGCKKSSMYNSFMGVLGQHDATFRPFGIFVRMSDDVNLKEIHRVESTYQTNVVIHRYFQYQRFPYGLLKNEF